MPSAMMPLPVPPPFVPVAAEPATYAQEAPHGSALEADQEHLAPLDPSRVKKLFVPLSHGEHERLAIAAVKTGLSRHQLVRDALEMYFEQLSADMGEDCACITGGFASRAGCCAR
jgi:hypothetical protein